MKKGLWATGFLLFVLFLSGCGDRSELERQAFVVTIGLDKGEEEHQVEVTFQVANPQVNTTQGAEAQNEKPSDTFTITADDLLSAKELAQSSLSREMTFSHLQTIIVGEDLAQDNLFHRIISSAMIDPEMRREAIMMVSKEPAQEFINANRPTMETRPHKYYEFMEDSWRKTGYVPISNLNIFFQRTDGELFLAAYATAQRDPKHGVDEDAFLAGEVPQKGGDPVQIIGSAVMHSGKMVGKLNGEETRIAQLLRYHNLIKTMTASFPDPNNEEYRVTVIMNQKSHTRIKVDTDQSPLKIEVEVPVRVQINSNLSLVDYTTSKKKRDHLKKSIEKDMEKASDSLIDKLQEEFVGEPFVWYAHARKDFWTAKDYVDYNWGQKFKDAQVDISYDVTIINYGEQLRPPTLEKLDKED